MRVPAAVLLGVPTAAGLLLLAHTLISQNGPQEGSSSPPSPSPPLAPAVRPALSSPGGAAAAAVAAVAAIAAAASKLPRGANGSVLSEARGEGEPGVMTVYTVGCGASGEARWQAYQAFALDYSWWRVRQPGRITRVAGDCRSEWTLELMSLSNVPGEDAAVLHDGAAVPPGYASSRVRVFFAAREGARNYAQGSKAHLLLRWLAHAPQEGTRYYLLLDPDMLFTAPVHPERMGAGPGRPAAQVSQINLFWRGWLKDLCGSACDYFPLRDDHRAVYSFHAGPPYVWHTADFGRFLAEWKPLVAECHRRNQGRVESDMMAYAIAAVKLRLPHVLLEKYDWKPGPGWGPLAGGCQGLMFRHPAHPDHVPPFLHYCSNYKVDNPYYFINKHWLRPVQMLGRDAVDCESPLLAEPPMPQLPVEPTAIQWDNYYSAKAMATGINSGLEALKERYCAAAGVVPRMDRSQRFGERMSMMSTPAPQPPVSALSQQTVHSVVRRLPAPDNSAAPSFSLALALTHPAERLCHPLACNKCVFHRSARSFLSFVANGSDRHKLWLCAASRPGSVRSELRAGKSDEAPGCGAEAAPQPLGHVLSAPAEAAQRALYACREEAVSDPLHAVAPGACPSPARQQLLGYVP